MTKLSQLHLNKSIYLLDKIPEQILKDFGVHSFGLEGDYWKVTLIDGINPEEVATYLLVLSKEFLDR